MKGATTDPCASMSKPPSINMIIIIGASHNFYAHLEMSKVLLKIPLYLHYQNCCLNDSDLIDSLREIQ